MLWTSVQFLFLVLLVSLLYITRDEIINLKEELRREKQERVADIDRERTERRMETDRERISIRARFERYDNDMDKFRNKAADLVERVNFFASELRYAEKETGREISRLESKATDLETAMKLMNIRSEELRKMNRELMHKLGSISEETKKFIQFQEGVMKNLTELHEKIKEYESKLNQEESANFHYRHEEYHYHGKFNNHNGNVQVVEPTAGRAIAKAIVATVSYLISSALGVVPGIIGGFAGLLIG